jgi:hypothetical protein
LLYDWNIEIGVARYYGPTARLNGKTAKDIIYGGTPLSEKFKTVKF